jgi:hypothetical protein
MAMSSSQVLEIALRLVVGFGEQLFGQNWDYRKVLLGFEPLSGTHSGANLSEVVVRTLQQHQILDWVPRGWVELSGITQNPAWVQGLAPKPNPKLGWVTLVRLSYGLYSSIKSSIECLRLRLDFSRTQLDPEYPGVGLNYLV